MLRTKEQHNNSMYHIQIIVCAMEEKVHLCMAWRHCNSLRHFGSLHWTIPVARSRTCRRLITMPNEAKLPFLSFSLGSRGQGGGCVACEAIIVILAQNIPQKWEFLSKGKKLIMVLPEFIVEVWL